MLKIINNIKFLCVIVTLLIIVNSCKKEHRIKLRIQNNFGVDITEVEAGGASFGDIQYGSTSEYKIILSGEDRVLRFVVPQVDTYKSIFYVNSRGKIKIQINPLGEDITFVEE
ncbi:MAG: hypothetical protein A2046_11000 [Bacteroidetes bacterium GWA2_30_7]|nr:MAG: hypothetical protein A2046_11000 [Bacteroidetes bacterium GWA2_30_7]